jgi:porphobilinogen synthase
MAFPQTRLRRLRQTPQLRKLIRETELNAADLVMPFFVRPGRGLRLEIPSLPGQFQYSMDVLLKSVGAAVEAGVGAVILFGIPDQKDSLGSGAYAKNGIVQEAARRIKKKYPDLCLIADLCLCEYTSHGHCGVLKGDRILNDETLKLYAKTAVSQAEAGFDVIAPSGMMDGQVSFIRLALDEAGFEMTPILAYAAKTASAFYGPFRDAVESAPKFGDRLTHQMDPSNFREALREISLDALEGGDMLMVKPALPCLDIIREARQRFDLPIAAYSVSGEYAMIKAAAKNGWLDEKKAALELLTSIKRAGADFIITYHALSAAQWLKEK